MSKDGQESMSKHHEAPHFPPLSGILAGQGEKYKKLLGEQSLTKIFEQVPRLDSKETLCALCRPSKRIVGANNEGCR